MSQSTNSNSILRVFLSHAREDKDRFAREFAEQLQARGVDVWFDEWELLPGDSLIDKIFEEGLKNADAIIIVLSAVSVQKQWVREELNAGVVQKIERQCRLIPVLIDDCAVPEALKSTVWIRVASVDSYEEELDRIVRAIFDERVKPPVGAPPAYVGILPIAGLQSTDTAVLVTACEEALANDIQLVDSRSVLDKVERVGITEAAFLESLEILEHQGHIEIVKTLASGLDGMSAFSVTSLGLDNYAQVSIDDYDETMKAVAGHLVNEGTSTDRDIADHLAKPRLLIEHILDVFEMHGLVGLSKSTGPLTFVHDVRPQLRRQFS